MSDLPAPLVDLVPTLSWFTLEEGSANVLQNTINITAIGTTPLPPSSGTFTSVYVNAPGLVTIDMPLTAGLVAGQRWAIIDTSGAAGTNAITVSGNGNEISGSPLFVMNIDYGSVVLEWNGSSFSLVV
jgi:hypothetical protein